MAKTELHRLVDELPETEVHAAKRYLAFLLEQSDPVLRALQNAPIDDEPLSPEEEEDSRQAREEYAQG